MFSETSPNVWYFAYGSNMSATKFTGGRGIIPLLSARVKVPGWVLSMEIPGMPYSEPAFLSIRPRSILECENAIPEVIGVAYMVTPRQYASVIGSEGGGIAYSDLSLQAEPVNIEDLKKTGPRIIVRTLGSVLTRYPNARPSSRYMDIIKAGAAENKLPTDYQTYLLNIRLYSPPQETRGRVGAAIFLALWGPIMSLMETLTVKNIGEDGYCPRHIALLVRLTVGILWLSHDVLFAPVWGRGDGLEKSKDWKEIEDLKS